MKRRTLLVGGLVALATAAAFLPALRNGFVNWDDPRNFLANPNFRGLGWRNVRWMFTTFLGGPYQPLSWLTLGADYGLWGLDPRGYHLTSLLLHAANAVLFYLLCLRLLPAEKHDGWAAPICAAFAALVFSAHPLRVESVAWVTERRDVVSGLFYISTLLCYLKSHADNKQPWGRVALASFILSLLGKGIGISLPAGLILCDVYILGRLPSDPRRWRASELRPVWREKIPYFLAAFLIAIVGYFGQRQLDAIRPLSSFGIGQRLAAALFGAAFYIRKTLIPTGLIPIIEIPDRFDPLAGEFAASAAFVLVLTGAFLALRRRWAEGMGVWLFYLITLAPVSGLAQFGQQLAADRYSYLSCLGWAALAGGGLLWCWRKGRSLRQAGLGLAGAIVLTLGALTWRQSGVWRDSETLWTHALAVDPGSVAAHVNLGNALVDGGKPREAIPHYQKALELRPASRYAHNNLGTALQRCGRLDEAMGHFRQAIALKPDYGEARYNLASTLQMAGRIAEAEEQYRLAIRLNPGDIAAIYNLGRIARTRAGRGTR
ncbi:MAG: tetratricopeptide repeat protein [Elusimicrobia bacterium]|nr:tetratricopeptide repeat protein [Elusimicrobiota bacterium]